MTISIALSNASVRYEPTAMQSVCSCVPVAPSPKRANYLTHRCRHGFQCDADDWLCPHCRNPHKQVTSNRRAWYYSELLEILRTGQFQNCVAISTELQSRTGSIVSPKRVYDCLKRLRVNGVVKGWTVAQETKEVKP